MKIITLLSGGLDSTTLLYLLKKDHEVKALTINYNQRHNKEILMAGKTCQKLGIDWLLLEIGNIKKILKGSALTDNIKVPEGRYNSMNMIQTVVPNRNMIFLSLAAAYALSLKYDAIAYAAHAGDHTIYPDCRESFFKSCEATINIGNAWNKPIKILVPFANMSKTDVLKIGVSLGVDYNLTWTCYVGLKEPCGKCGACNERAEAFQEVGVEDPLLKEVKV